MKACNIGRTIIIWDKLNDNELIRLLKALSNLISNYRNYISLYKLKYPLPVPLYVNNIYLGIIKKHDEVIISMTKKDQDWNICPILNGDELYKSIKYIENYNIIKFYKMYEKFPDETLNKLSFMKAFEIYLLTPNINPESFIKNLERGTLSNQDKQFLKEIGFSLTKQEYSKEIKEVLDEINELFEER